MDEVTKKLKKVSQQLAKISFTDNAIRSLYEKYVGSPNIPLKPLVISKDYTLDTTQRLAVRPSI